MTEKKHYLIPIIASAYVLLLLIGSTYPFFNWQWPTYENWANSFESTTRYIPRSDFIINFLIYIPLGILASILLQTRVNNLLLLITSAALASGFAVTMEILQLFIPSRAHSLIDLSMNTAGAICGALLHHITKKHSSLGRKLRNIRYNWFKRGRYAELGMVTIGLWALSEITPLAPAFEYSAIASDYHYFTQHLFLFSQLDFYQTIGFSFKIFALFLITELILIRRTTSLFIFGTFAGIIIYIKLPVADILLQAEYIWGLTLGVAFYFFTQNENQTLRTKLVMYALLLTYLINQLNHPAQPSIENYNAFNWLPFDSNTKRITRITEILSIAWIFLALSFFTLSIKQKATKKNGLIGLAIVTIVSASLEWQQQSLQNASADITDVLIVMFAWALPYFHPEIRKGIK